MLTTLTSCNDLFESLDVTNKNEPIRDNLYVPAEMFALLKNGYNAWWNGSIAASPSIGFACANVITSGTAGWGSGEFWGVPRRALPNAQVADPVILYINGAWYNYYAGIPTVTNIIRMFNDPSYKVVIGGVDYTNRVKAHAYIIQSLLYGNIALLYDKAYLFTEESDPATFDYAANTKTYKEIMDYVISKLELAISMIAADNTDSDPQSVIPGTTFDKHTLLQFANSMAARFLVCNARTPNETSQVDWAKVKAFATNGLQQDFTVEYEEGWRGKVMSRDAGASYFAIHNWNWIRVNQWLLNKMAPNDPAAQYPWPNGISRLYQITNCPDARFTKYFKYDELPNWFGWTRVTRPYYGYFILSEYRYWRYYDVVDQGAGAVGHYLKTENDTYLAEAKLRLGETSGIASLINNSRVTLGNLPAASDSDPDLMEKLMYERYVECDLVWIQLSYFDKRRRGELLEGTAYHFPIPAGEALQHGQAVYTFGGVGNEM